MAVNNSHLLVELNGRFTEARTSAIGIAGSASDDPKGTVATDSFVASEIAPAY